MLLNSYRGVSNSGHSVTASAVYLAGQRLPEADPATFEPLPGEHSRYFRDARHVILQSRIVAGADPGSFAPVLYEDGQHSSFWRDAHSVYHDGKRLDSVDPQTFEPIGRTRFARDRSHVYYESIRIEGADRDTFSVIDNSIYARDKARVYQAERVVFSGADPARLEVLEGEHFARDGAHVFPAPGHVDRSASPIPGADAATFVALDRSYGKDRERVYRYDYGTGEVTVVAGADSSSFEVTPYDSQHQSEARDRHAYYMEGKRVAARWPHPSQPP